MTQRRGRERGEDSHGRPAGLSIGISADLSKAKSGEFLQAIVRTPTQAATQKNTSVTQETTRYCAEHLFMHDCALQERVLPAHPPHPRRGGFDRRVSITPHHSSPIHLCSPQRRKRITHATQATSSQSQSPSTPNNCCITMPPFAVAVHLASRMRKPSICIGVSQYTSKQTARSLPTPRMLKHGTHARLGVPTSASGLSVCLSTSLLKLNTAAQRYDCSKCTLNCIL